MFASGYVVYRLIWIQPVLQYLNGPADVCFKWSYHDSSKFADKVIQHSDGNLSIIAFKGFLKSHNL